MTNRKNVSREREKGLKMRVREDTLVRLRGSIAFPDSGLKKVPLNPISPKDTSKGIRLVLDY